MSIALVAHVNCFSGTCACTHSQNVREYYWRDQGFHDGCKVQYLIMWHCDIMLVVSTLIADICLCLLQALTSVGNTNGIVIDSNVNLTIISGFQVECSHSTFVP